MVLKNYQSLFFFFLTPIYLGMVYYKTVYDVDTNGLLLVSLFILFVSLPFYIILSKNKQTTNITNLLRFITPLDIFLYFIFIAIIVDGILLFLSGFNSYTTALLLTLAMISLSVLGSYLQLKIFTGIFFKNFKKPTLILFFVFYSIMITNILFIDTIERTSTKIYEAEKSDERLNSSYKDSFSQLF